MRKSWMTVVFLSASLSSWAQTSARDEVIATVKAQWAAEMKHDVSTAMTSVADDYTEFNPDFATRLDGKALAFRLAEAGNADPAQLLAAEMANEKVQVYGDVAILSYNFIGLSKDKDGAVHPVKAKSTRVYLRKDGQWWLVHANFGQDD